jgi:hypothetical protein
VMWEVPTEGKGNENLPASRWGEFKKIAGVLTARIPIDSRSSCYAHYGDVFAWSCWVGVGAMVVWVFWFSGVRRRRFRRA